MTRRFMKTTVYGFQHRYDSPFIPGGSVDDVQAHNRRASRRQCNRPFRRVRTFADIRRADEQPGRVLIADSHAHRGVVVAGHDSRRRQHAAESRILDERQFITCLMSDQHPITAVNQIGAGHHTDDTGTGHGQCTWIDSLSPRIIHHDEAGSSLRSRSRGNFVAVRSGASPRLRPYMNPGRKNRGSPSARIGISMRTTPSNATEPSLRTVTVQRHGSAGTRFLRASRLRRQDRIHQDAHTVPRRRLVGRNIPEPFLPHCILHCSYRSHIFAKRCHHAPKQY